MKPYPGENIPGSNERIFNYSLSRARRIVENVFGIVSAVFRVLRKPLLVQPDSVKTKTLACAHLHNFLRRSITYQQLYTPPRIFDASDMDYDTLIPGTWRQNELPTVELTLLPLKPTQENNNNDERIIRKELREYFISDVGRINSQDRYA